MGNGISESGPVLTELERLFGSEDRPTDALPAGVKVEEKAAKAENNYLKGKAGSKWEEYRERLIGEAWDAVAGGGTDAVEGRSRCERMAESLVSNCTWLDPLAMVLDLDVSAEVELDIRTLLALEFAYGTHPLIDAMMPLYRAGAWPAGYTGRLAQHQLLAYPISTAEDLVNAGGVIAMMPQKFIASLPDCFDKFLLGALFDRVVLDQKSTVYPKGMTFGLKEDYARSGYIHLQVTGESAPEGDDDYTAFKALFDFMQVANIRKDLILFGSRKRYSDDWDEPDGDIDPREFWPLDGFDFKELVLLENNILVFRCENGQYLAVDREGKQVGAYHTISQVIAYAVELMELT